MKKFKWTGRQLKALKSSLQKWEAICKGDAVERGTGDCMCCEYYLGGCSRCTNCPISIFAGKIGCIGTPYENWMNSFATHTRIANTPERKKLARKERDFIKKVIKAGSC